MTVNSEGSAAMDAERTSRMHSLLLCVPLCISVYSLSALFWYHVRRDQIEVRSTLQTLYAAIYGTFGFSACVVFFLLLLIWTSIWFFAGHVERPLARLLRLSAVAVMLGVFLNLGRVPTDLPTQGTLGLYLAQRLEAAIGYPVSWLLVFVSTVGALLLATDFFFSDSFERALGRMRGERDSDRELAHEHGVEAAVTEHLKGLAQVAPAKAPVPSVHAFAKAVAAAADAETEAEADEAAATAAADRPPRDEPAPEESRSTRRRQSYFERRRAWADDEGAAPEQWVPAAESQEIDNPESVGEAETRALAEALAVGASAEDGDEVYEERASAAAAEADVAAEDEVDDLDDADAEAADEDEVDEDEVDEDDDVLEPEAGSVEEEEEADEEEFAAEADDAAAEDGDDALAARAEVEDEEIEDADAEDADSENADSEHDERPSPVAVADAPAADERVFAIPRPEQQPAAEVDEVPAEEAAEFGRRRRRRADADEAMKEDSAPTPPTRQRGLFGPSFDEDLLAEAKQIVLESRRPTAALLRRRLRIGYEEACEVLAELSARGIVEIEPEA